jgi:hypothetical protein
MQSWMNSERIALEEALSGVENIANFSYGEESQVLRREGCQTPWCWHIARALNE